MKLLAYIKNNIKKLTGRRDEESIYRQLFQFLKEISTEQEPKKERVFELRSFIKREFIPFIDEIDLPKEAERFDKINYEIERFVENSRMPWTSSKVIVATAGQFSSGKSSFMNTLFGQSLLPVAITRTTAVPTYIYHSEKYKEEFALKNESTKEYSGGKSILEQIKYYEKYRFPWSLLFDWISVGYPMRKELYNYVFLDTPGYTGNPRDRRIAGKQLSSSDVILFFIDIERGTPTSKDMEFIKEYVHKPLLILVNKVDKIPSNKATDVVKHIRKEMEFNNVKYLDVLPFSCPNKDEEKVRKIIHYLNEAQSSFVELHKFIMNDVLRLYESYLGKQLKETRQRDLLMRGGKTSIIVQTFQEDCDSREKQIKKWLDKIEKYRYKFQSLLKETQNETIGDN